MWLVEDVIRYLQRCDFAKKAQEVEGLIPVSTYRGLAPCLALMYLIGNQLEDAVPGILGMSRTGLKEVVGTWVTDLGLNNTEELLQYNDLLVGLQGVFEAARTGPEGEVFELHHKVDEETYGGYVKVINTILRDKRFRVHSVKPSDLPREGAWFGLEGSTTEWLATLSSSGRELFPGVSVISLGWMFERLATTKPLFRRGSKVSDIFKNGPFYLQKILNAGPQRSQRGWRVMIRTDGLG